MNDVDVMELHLLKFGKQMNGINISKSTCITMSKKKYL